MKLLDADPLPDCIRHLWDWFVALDIDERPDGMNGLAANPIPSLRIESWARQRWIDLHPWEFDLIKTMDRIKRAVYARNRPGKK